MPNGTPPPGRPGSRPPFFDWLLADRRTGRITLVQWPNPVLWVWAVATAVTGLGLHPSRADEIHWIGSGALIAWGVDEIIRGVNPARRFVGLIVLGWQIYQLIS